MNIKRISDYSDSRFSDKILKQHGCFEVDEDLFEIEIISEGEAIIHGNCEKLGDDIKLLCKEFRFYAPHIWRFYNSANRIIEEFDKAEVFEVLLEDIQPSQFLVDREKVEAVSSFIHCPEDIIIQVVKYNNRFISLDGHTRLYYASSRQFKKVRAVFSESASYIYDFVEEAVRRGVKAPQDLKLADHDEYVEKWYQFCDDYFSKVK